MNTSTTRTALYARISQDPTGEALGVERQLKDCRALAQQLGWTVVGEYTDNDRSAYSGKPRPAYERLLTDIQAGKVDAVVVWHPDRLYRRMVDLGRLVDVVEKNHCAIRTVKAGELDLTTPTGRMTAKILANVAEHEVELKAARQAAGNLQAAGAGKWRTKRRVFGYRQDGQELEPAEAEAIRQAAADIIAGASAGDIARRWNAQGLESTGSATQWRSSSVVETLRKPLYARRVVYRGKLLDDVRGEWPGILTDDVHLALCAIFDARRQGPRPRRWQGTGIYRCGRCDDGQTMNSAKGVSGYHIYRCPRLHLSRQARALDDYVSDVVATRLAQPDAHLVLDNSIDVSELRTQRDALQSRLDSLARMFAEGHIDHSQLQSGSEALHARQAELDAQIAAQAQHDPVADLILGGKDIRARWDTLTPDRRGKIIDLLMTVTVLPVPLGRLPFDPKYVDIQWKEPS